MKKALFTIGTLLPIFYGIALLFVGFDESPLARTLDTGYPVVVGIALVTWIAYFFDIWRNAELGRDKKGLWTALLIFGSIFAEVAYLWLHILRSRREPDA
jgi:hypothetical protein